jgi:hypothetical protein
MAQDTDQKNGTSNEAIIRAFANSFSPPLPVVGTQRLNGERVHDGWQAAFWSQKHCVGLTAVVHGKGVLRAWVETGGDSDPADAKAVAAIFRRALEEFGVCNTDGGADGQA